MLICDYVIFLFHLTFYIYYIYPISILIFVNIRIFSFISWFEN